MAASRALSGFLLERLSHGHSPAYSLLRGHPFGCHSLRHWLSWATGRPAGGLAPSASFSSTQQVLREAQKIDTASLDGVFARAAESLASVPVSLTCSSGLPLNGLVRTLLSPLIHSNQPQGNSSTTLPFCMPQYF
jgi:hypothetical protein